ncbi:MAG: hypothetical protein ABL921_03230, partial [Pirellula sp.]
GRFLTPKGERLYTGDDLWNVVPSPDGKWIVGLCDPGIVVYPSRATVASNQSIRIPWSRASFCAVFSKDSSKLITSSGDQGHGIQVFSTSEWEKLPTRRLEERKQVPIQSITAHEEAHIVDIVVSSDERYVFGADVARQRIVVFDLLTGNVVSDVPAGREPFSLALSSDGSQLFVANIGVRLFDRAARHRQPARSCGSRLWFPV